MPATIYRTAAFLFSIVCYGVFLLVFLYLLAFLGNLQATPLVDAFPVIRVLVPNSVDLGRDMGSLGFAVVVDIGLILLFGLQHSVMARPGFKRIWTRVVPKEMERSVYVLDRERHAGAAHVAVAPDPDAGSLARGRGLECRSRLVSHGPRCRGAAVGHVPDQSLRVVRTAAGLDHAARRRASGPRIRHAVPLQDRAPSAVRGMAADLLGRADDDRGSLSVLGGHERLHPDRHPLRGTRPGGSTSASRTNDTGSRCRRSCRGPAGASVVRRSS